MPQAKWQGALLADSNDTIVIEGNHYFQVRAGKDLNGSGAIDIEEIDPSPAAASWTIGTIVPLDRESDRPIRYFGAS